MRLARANFSSLVNRRPASRSGVALVITIVMLSVITFLTVAFLALMGREKGAVKTSIDQTTAQLAAGAALERAKAEMLASMLATTNLASFDLLVSTNFINWNGFDPAAQNTLNSETNVNFDYVIGGGGVPLSLDQSRQNLTNLLYSPRVPVFITNRLVANSVDFRYYLDLNRNFRHDRTGLWPVTNQFGVTVLNTNSLILSNYFIGDPEWIGGLDRPDKPHGPDNKFLYRYAYVVVPEGKTLDVNYIHNQAVTRALTAANDGFFRNQGVASWELNLAGFLVDLNTNLWNPNGNLYDYRLPTTGFPNKGLAFEDALSILSYRYANNYNTLAFGYTNFLGNLVDEYSDGAWLRSATNLPLDTDITVSWAGSDNTNHYFSMQDLFTKTPGGFGTRLKNAGSSLSTYDQYTYYRMLAQLGADSAPEDPDKLNLNYVNVGGLAATNFVPWTDDVTIQARFGVPGSVLFFTNVVDRLLRKYSEEWLVADSVVYTNLFKTTDTFSMTNIPVMISNQWVYSTSIHRVLQMAANIWETKNSTNAFPTVFRPRFRADAAGTNIYIYDFVPETTEASVLASTSGRVILDLLATNNPAAAIPLDGNVLVYGVPLVIGAKKGLPNFNEFQIEPTFTMTRKIQLVKPSATSTTVSQTNQFFTMSLTMPSASEFWNSYLSNYTRPVTIFITNRTTFTLTNDLGVNFSTTFVTDDRFSTNLWPRVGIGIKSNFIVLMRTNVPFLPSRGYVPKVGFFTNNANVFDQSQELLMPRWGMTISNRVHGMILEQGTGRIIDYVLLGNMTYTTNLTDIFSSPATWATAFGDQSDDQTSQSFKKVWSTNAFSGSLLSGRPGIEYQIRISRGDEAGLDETIIDSKWKSYGAKLSGGTTVSAAIDFFNKFLTADASTNKAIVPFSPSIQFSIPMIWQANDPLVHYIADDLLYLEKSGQVALFDPQKPNLTVPLENIGALNKRYLPWGKEPGVLATDPDAFNTSIKDPLVTSSDIWQFPTNVLPTVGWLGRIHRGTPWQTIYLKSSNLGLPNIVNSPSEWVSSPLYAKAAQKWAEWTGNKNYEEGFYTRPVEDRVLFDVFTTALNDNSARGRLPVNQTNIAAWSAVFSGVAALTNTTPESILATLSAPFTPAFNPWIIEPAGIYDPYNAATKPPLLRMVEGINQMRANTNFFPNGVFTHMGDILAVPELTDLSPFLNQSTDFAKQRGISDAVYEWLPQQTMSLLQLGEPRFVVYAYGQSLQPAPDSIVTAGGAFFGLCTNYAITAEVATRAVVRIEGSPNPSQTNTNLPAKLRYPPRIVVESFNYLAPE